jgi:hypothetical protein
VAFDHNIPGAEQVAQIVFGGVLLYVCALAVSRRLLGAAPPDGPHAA